jgi:molybdopterin/thiamine biosynthesis adenylyltransferase
MIQFQRFKDAPWLVEDSKILVAGCGGIGSNAFFNLYRAIKGTFYLVDMDRVEAHNLDTQFFKKDTIGAHKAQALSITVKTIVNSSNPINPIVQEVTENTNVLPITISAFDNMKARKALYNSWKKKEDREILIDGRLRSTYYQIYTVTKGREEEYEATLFDDDEVDSGPCTFKQTPHFGMLIGARITQILTNYLSNKFTNEEVCVVPFMVEESGDLMYFKTDM